MTQLLKRWCQDSRPGLLSGFLSVTTMLRVIKGSKLVINSFYVCLSNRDSEIVDKFVSGPWPTWTLPGRCSSERNYTENLYLDKEGRKTKTKLLGNQVTESKLTKPEITGSTMTSINPGSYGQTSSQGLRVLFLLVSTGQEASVPPSSEKLFR